MPPHSLGRGSGLGVGKGRHGRCGSAARTGAGVGPRDVGSRGRATSRGRTWARLRRARAVSLGPRVRDALAQWTLPRRAVPSPEDGAGRGGPPRAAASAAMGSNSAPLGEEEDHHETDDPTTTSLTTDYDELDADYFARRTESKIIDPLDRQLERWYRTTDESAPA